MTRTILILLNLSFFVFAQEIALERFDTKDGLSQNSITSIVQDSTGFLWFGTYDGLNRYDGYKFKAYRHNPNNPNSLNHNLVRTICIDYKGNLWIGTMGGGLNFYDYSKDTFKSFQYNSEDTTSISDNSIRSLLIDKDGYLWIGTTAGGVNRFFLPDFYKTDDINTPIKFRRFLNTTTETPNINLNRITDMYQDRNANIWIGTRNGLCRFDPESQSMEYFFSNLIDPNTLLHNDISAISEDKNGNIWIGNWEYGLNQYIPEEQKFIRYPFKENSPYSPSYNMIMCLYKDSDHDLWIGTWGGGLNKLKISGDKIDLNRKTQKVSFIHYNDNSRDLYPIDNISVYSIFEDKSGVLWIGSDWNGLYKNIEKNRKFKNYFIGANKIISHNQNNVFDIRIDYPLNNLLLATRYNGINVLNLNNNQSRFYMHDSKNPYSINHNKVRTFFKDRTGRLWIGTEIGLDEFISKDQTFIHYILDKNDPYGHNTFAIQDDRFGNLWIGTYGAGLFKFDKNTGKIVHYLYDINNPNSLGDDIIWKIFEDKRGNLWIGTSKGLHIYDYENDRFIRHLHEPENPNSISGNKILTIFETNSGQLWFGTTAGLNRLDTKENFLSQLQFTRYTTEDGLPTNTIHGILEDDHGNLWICTNRGLSNFDISKNYFHNYDEGDGLQDIEFSVNACFKDTTTGRLYFGSINGFNVFHPDSIRFNKIVPNIVFTELKILNQPVSVNSKINNRVILYQSLSTTDSIYITHDDLMFSLEFSALHFSSPDNNRFAYILEGFEKNWNNVGADQRVATYSNLNPGTYIFKVRASNNDKVWNETGKKLTIIVVPSWWQTWWFKLILALVLGGFLISAYLIRMNRIKSINRSLEWKVQERTAQLEESNKELEAFAYSVSHDLRAPLRGINGFTRVIEEDFENELSKDLKKYFQKIKNTSSRMENLIDNILKLSRIIRAELKKEKVNLSEIASEIIEELKLSYPDRLVDIKIQPNMFAVVDAGLIRIVLENLLSNAFKFTRLESKTIIEFGSDYTDGKNIYYIHDNGVGFDQKFAENLFIPFSRLHPENEFEGSGIGLSSCKKIIEKHHGKIWAESKENEGTTIYFYISST